jgi:hypothetical protein
VVRFRLAERERSERETGFSHACGYAWPMHLVQLLLPLRNNSGAPFPRSFFESLRDELTQRFGGVTTYNRAPAEGLFSDESGRVQRDDVVIFEVMCDALDEGYWAQHRLRLTALFAQEDLVVRALPLQRL